MIVEFDSPAENLRVMLDLRGGAWDGSVEADRVAPTLIDDASDSDAMGAAIAMVAWAETNRGQVGRTFKVPSFPEAERQIVRRHSRREITMHVYRIVERLDGDGEVLLRADYEPPLNCSN